MAKTPKVLDVSEAMKMLNEAFESADLDLLASIVSMVVNTDEQPVVVVDNNDDKKTLKQIANDVCIGMSFVYLDGEMIGEVDEDGKFVAIET